MTSHQATAPSAVAVARPFANALPLELVVHPIPRLLELLQTSALTLSRSEIQRLAAEASVADLVPHLGAEEPAVVERTLIVLGLKASEEAVEALSHVAEATDRGAEIQAMALESLILCGPAGRERLLDLSRRAEMVEITVDALGRAADFGGFRPAAMARLTEIAADRTVSRQSRAIAILSVVNGGWAAGAETLREVAEEMGCQDLVEAWAGAGWVAGSPREPEEREALCPLDFESAFFRGVEAITDARTEATRRLEEHVAAEVREILPTEGKAWSQRVGRNDACPCGSGKKYKKCCADAPKPHNPRPLALALAEKPLPLRGFRVSPFERSEAEQQKLAYLVAAQDSDNLGQWADGPYLTWAVALRLYQRERYGECLPLLERLVKAWGEEPAIDYLEALLCALILAGNIARDRVPELAEVAAQRAPDWAILQYVTLLQQSDSDPMVLLEPLVTHREDDVAALLAWAAGVEGGFLEPSEETIALLERLEELLARHDELDFAHQAFLRVEGLRSEVEEMLEHPEEVDHAEDVDDGEDVEDVDDAGAVRGAEGGEEAEPEVSEPAGSAPASPPVGIPSEGRVDATAEALEEDALPWLEIDGASLSVYLQADGRAELIEAGLEEPVELIEECARAAWDEECRIRQQALDLETERTKVARVAVLESLEKALETVPDSLLLCRLEDGISWVLPRDASLEVVCVVAAAAGLLEARLGAGPLEISSRAHRPALHLSMPAEPGDSLLPVARGVVVEVAQVAGVELPPFVRVPLGLTDWLQASPLGETAPEGHPLREVAAAQETTVLRLAERWGAEGTDTPWLLAAKP